MPSKLKKAIAVVKDQTSIGLAKVSSNVSSNLEVAVLKATSHDDVPVDEKHICEVLQLVSSNKVHAAACARAIGKRIGRTRNWVVALKSLMLVLRIFQDGDPYFPREVLHAMKRGAKILNLSSFRDDSNSSPWDFTSFVRTFALYLDERLECFLTGKLQRRYTHEGSTPVYQRSKSRGANEPVRDMKPAMLLDKMSYWQRLLDRAIATRPTGAAKTNRMIHVALYAILQESFDLYKDISDGLSLVLDSFFHLQYQNCVTAYQTCLKAVKQFEELSAFFSLCKSLGVGRSSEYPTVQGISEETIETLQEFLKDQSSFPSNVRPINQVLSSGPPPNPRMRTCHSSCRSGSYGGQSDFSATTDGFSDQSSEFGSQSASLEDLISAAETGTAPSISIDLEAYSPSKREDVNKVSDTASTRSLPGAISGTDLMSLDDWSDDDDEEEQVHQVPQQDQQEEKQKGIMDPSASQNWETMLAETLISTSSSSSSPQPAPPALPQPHTDNNTNTFSAFSEQPSNGWNLALFEAAPPPSQPTPDVQIPVDNNYNPFLQDLMELSGTSNSTNQESAAPVPAFEAVPTFSAQNPNLNSFEGDPFACGAEFGGGQTLSSTMDEQNMQQQLELWLQNQNKIIAKHMS